MIPIAKPAIGEEEIEAVERVLRSGMLADGEEVRKFEQNFADYCGAKYAIAVNNGTAALHASLLASGISRGDEVIVPSFTFIATATSVSMCGAVPVFADIDPRTFCIDPDNLPQRITPKTKAIIGVHLFGHPFDLQNIKKICNENDLILIEDCAQAHGAEVRGKRVGAFGDVGCFSFYPTKNMTTGEGGMIITEDPEIAKRSRRIIDHGQSEKYLHTELGYNYRMTNISAAIGKVQLAKLGQFNEARRANAAMYQKYLTHPGLLLPAEAPDTTHVYHQFVVRLTTDFPMNRPEFIHYLKDRGIGAAVHYPIPVHQQPLYHKENEHLHLRVSEECAQSVLSLPVHPQVTEREMRYISDAINEVR